MRASQIYRYHLCPGSMTAESKVAVKAEPLAGASGEGTKIHHALSVLMEGTITDTDDACVIANVEDDRSKMIVRWFYAKAKALLIDGHKCHSIETEKQFDIDWLTGRPDVVAVSDNSVHVIDWKTGFAEVAPAEQNLQVRAYAVLAHESMHYDNVYCHIFSAAHTDGPPFTSTCYGLDDLNAAKEELVGILTRCQNEPNIRIPNRDACKYCKARGNIQLCPESVRAHQLPVLATQKPSTDLAATYTRAWQTVKEWRRDCDMFEKHFKELVSEHPDAFPDVSLVPGRVRANVDDPSGVFSVGLENNWWNQQQFMSAVRVEVGKLDELIRNAKSLSAKKARETLLSTCGEFISEKVGEPILRENKALE